MPTPPSAGFFLSATSLFCKMPKSLTMHLAHYENPPARLAIPLSPLSAGRSPQYALLREKRRRVTLHWREVRLQGWDDQQVEEGMQPMKYLASLAIFGLLAGCAATTKDQSTSENRFTYHLYYTNPYAKHPLGGGGSLDLRKGEARTLQQGPFTIKRCETPVICRQGVVTVISELVLLEQTPEHAKIALSTRVKIGKEGTLKTPNTEMTATTPEGVPLITQDFSLNRTVELASGQTQTVQLIPEARIIIGMQ